MTTIAYCAKTNIIAADTQLTFDNYAEFCAKIVFPKKGVVLAAAGDSGQGEWFGHKLSTLSSVKEIYELHSAAPKMKDFEAFLWWGKPYMIFNDLSPVPIEGNYYVCGTGGSYALAYMRDGLTPYEAAFKATKIDPYSSPPIHWIDLNSGMKKIEVYDVCQTPEE